MGFHTRIGLSHRCGAQVQQTRRRGAQQHDLVGQASRWQAPGQHIRRRHVPKGAAVRPAAASKGDQHRHPRVHPDGQLSALRHQTHAFQRLVAARQKGLPGKTGNHFRLSQQGAKHAQCQRLVIVALVFGQQRQGPHHTIAIGERIEETRAGRGLGQACQVGAVAIPLCGRNMTPFPDRVPSQNWCRQYTAGATISIAGEVITQHHGAALERVRQLGVVVQLRGHGLHPPGKVGLEGQFLPGQSPQLRQPPTLIGLGENRVNAQNRNLLLVKEPVHQSGHVVSPPWPATHLRKAFLINVNDDYALIAR